MTDLERRVTETAGWLAYSLDYMLDVKDGKRTPRGWKRCSSCRRLKRPESFYRFHRSRDGRLGRCKSCFLKRKEELKRERQEGSAGKSALLTTIGLLLWVGVDVLVFNVDGLEVAMSQKAVLLWKLKQGPVCSFSFYQPGSGLTHRAAARVQDLKREGYEITSRPCDLGHGHLSRAVVYELQTNGRLF